MLVSSNLPFLQPPENSKSLGDCRFSSCVFVTSESVWVVRIFLPIRSSAGHGEWTWSSELTGSSLSAGPDVLSISFLSTRKLVTTSITIPNLAKMDLSFSVTSLISAGSSGSVHRQLFSSRDSGPSNHLLCWSWRKDDKVSGHRSDFVSWCWSFVPLHVLDLSPAHHLCRWSGTGLKASVGVGVVSGFGSVSVQEGEARIVWISKELQSFPTEASELSG